MARRSQRTNGSPTILWIAWRAGEAEHQEPLCRDHREYIFQNYPVNAHGQGRRGDQCSMCLAQPLPTAQLRSPVPRATPQGRRIRPETARPGRSDARFVELAKHSTGWRNIDSASSDGQPGDDDTGATED